LIPFSLWPLLLPLKFLSNFAFYLIAYSPYYY
jgi:hypothetical protein